MELIIIFVILVIWSFIEPRIMLNIFHERAEIYNLPESWRGRRVAFITDLQIGLWFDNRNMVRRCVKKIIKARPDVVLIGGDFVYRTDTKGKAKIQAVVNILKPLIKENIPVYAVLGNHDYDMCSKSAKPNMELVKLLTDGLEDLGIKILNNDSVALTLPNSEEVLYIVGTDSRWADRDSAKDALSNVPIDSPRIVLIHNPDTFELFPAYTAPVAIAGHTHGGQISVPGRPKYSWLSLSQKDKIFADGWTDEYGEEGNRLYISRGIGMSIAPIRLFCPPEITLFTLDTPTPEDSPVEALMDQKNH